MVGRFGFLISLLVVSFAVAHPRDRKRNQNQEVSYNCPTDFSLQGGSCFQQKFAEPEAFCPVGAVLQHIDCVSATEKVMNCPPDAYYSDAHNACVTEIRAPAVASCAESQQLLERNGAPVCQEVVVTTSTPYCEGSMQLDGPSCWRPDGTSPHMTCDAGETLVEPGMCQHDVEYDCGFSDSYHRVLLGRHSSTESKLGARRQCKRSIKRQAKRQCKSGGRVLNNSCVDPTPEPAMYKCPGVCSVESTCTHVVNTPPSWMCPRGYEEICRGGATGCYCGSVAEVEYVAECPVGYEDYGDGICLQYFPAAVKCPEGYNLDGSSCVQTCYSEARVVYVPTVVHTQTCGGAPCS